jgi:ammonium transporter, Amt family
MDHARQAERTRHSVGRGSRFGLHHASFGLRIANGVAVPMASLVIGVAGGLVCFLACTTLKGKFGYDDSLDAFGVHGIGGTLGAILTGVFATRAVGGTTGDKLLGILEGGDVLLPQLIAVAITWALAIVATFIILKVLDATMGLRVVSQDEIQGLDLTAHGEEGYIFL